MTSILYFSYGSNMSTPRLIKRVPSAVVVSVATLDCHRLKFHKRSVDGSAKCDIEMTDESGAIVHGVVFEIAASEKPYLDRMEGLGIGYDEKIVSVVDGGGRAIEAVTYHAIDIDPSLKPYHWYKEHVVRGAREHNLPLDYIEILESIESIPDPNPDNHEKELSIYY